MTEVGEDRHLAADVGSGRAAGQGLRQHLRAQPVDGLAGDLGLGARWSVRRRGRPRPPAATPAAARPRRSRVRRDGGGEGREDAGVPRDVDRDDQGTVGAGSEPFRDQVVGPPLGARLRHRPLVGEAEAQRGHRRRQGEQQDRGPDGVRRGVAADVRTPPAPAEAGRVLVGGAATVDPVPREPHQRRQQGDGGEHHHQHDQGDADAAGGDERDPGDGQAQDGHDDGAAGEDDRAAGGGQGAADRVLDVAALGEVLAEAGQDEQRVVDADARVRSWTRSRPPSWGCRRRTPRGTASRRRPRGRAARSRSAGPWRRSTRRPGAGSRSRPPGRGPRRRRWAPARTRSTGRRRPRSAAPWCRGGRRGSP